MSYKFSMFRFVPDPARGEFINIGAVAGDDDSRDWGFRLIQNLSRAKAIDEGGRLRIALEFADEIVEHIAAADELVGISHEAMSSRLLDRWSSEMLNIVQLSEPRPIIAASAEEALDLVFAELVLDRAARSFRFEKKHRAVGSTRKAYREHGVPESSIVERATVVAGPYEERFDFAVFDGTVVQLTHCWSFQLPNQAELAEEVRAWAWVVRELRDRGGELRLAKRHLAVAPDVYVASVSIPPRVGDLAHAYDEAKAAFEETEVHAFTPETAGGVAEFAATRLAGRR